MKLTDMKRSKKERKETCKPIPYDGETYAYGLQLRLGEEEIEKLGLTMPKAGDVMRVEALAKVTSTSTNERDGEKRQSIELQIQKIALEKEDSSMLGAVNKGLKELKS